MDAQIPMLAEKPLVSCGCNKFKVDSLGDQLSTCTTHSGAKKAHDWAVGQVADLFHTIHTSKTQQVVRSRGQYCGDPQIPEDEEDNTFKVPKKKKGQISIPLLKGKHLGPLVSFTSDQSSCLRCDH
jgi:hypothetical protein